MAKSVNLGKGLKRTRTKRPVRERLIRKLCKTASSNVLHKKLRKKEANEPNKKRIKRANVDSKFTRKRNQVISTRKNLPLNKGKEKAVEKQVCGICLSEEGERKARGALNCCCHYFCFACIMEWSKVESRCPTCKQRFDSIRKTAIGINLRNVEIVVPKRDQVYQPSEEELMNYIDPYENVNCKECCQGVDDELVLLCDRCDTAAHTYCVGLGLEVPDGNWYCDTCKQTDLSSPNTPSMNHGSPDNLSVGSAPVAAARETVGNNDTNYVRETPLGQLAGQSILEAHSNENSEATSPYHGSLAVTLSERRQTQRQIHQFLNDRSRMLDRSDQITGTINPLGSQTLENALVSPQQASTQVGTPPQSIYDQGRLPDYNTPSLDNTEVASPELFCIGEQGVCNQASTSANHHRNASHYTMGKEQVQCMVKRHLKSLSRKMELGYYTFKETARTSTHTVLAALGLDHRAREVHPLLTQPLVCTHLEGSPSWLTCPKTVQCPSCFDRFVRNVVKEILYVHVPVGCQSFQKE